MRWKKNPMNKLALPHDFERPWADAEHQSMMEHWIQTTIHEKHTCLDKTSHTERAGCHMFIDMMFNTHILRECNQPLLLTEPVSRNRKSERLV